MSELNDFVSRDTVVKEIRNKYPDLDDGEVSLAFDLIESATSFGSSIMHKSGVKLSLERVRAIMSNVDSIINLCIMEK